METRSCGDCVACCKILVVDTPEFKKPAGVLCNHCSGTGCAIYETRFPICRSYLCVWRRIEPLDDTLRPDRLGILFQYVEIADSDDILRRKFFAAVPLEPFADYSKTNLETALGQLRLQKLPIWLTFGDVSRCVYPEKPIQALLRSGEHSSTPEIQAQLDDWRSRLGI